MTLLLLVSSLSTVKAQDNVVKLHLEGLAFKQLNFSYERVLSDKLSAGAKIGFFIPGKIPGLVYTPEIPVDGYVANELLKNRFTGVSIVPEIRFYPGGKAPKGFYLGAYIRYNTYKLGLSQTESYKLSDQEYQDLSPTEDYYSLVDHTNKSIDATLDLEVKLRQFGLGGQIGVQWCIGDKVTIDWGIIGIGYDFYKISGKVSAVDIPVDYAKYSAEAEETFNKDIEGLPFIGNSKVTVEADKESVTASLPFSSIGVRSFLSIGFRF